MMSQREAGGLSIEQWMALNDEIAALVRAGLPLERGLDGMGRGRLGEAARALSDRLRRGEGLEAALEAEASRVPPIYRAVVQAGIRSGRLATALEGMASYARSFLEMRRMLALALLYPLLVMALAYSLFMGFLVLVLPTFRGAFTSLRLSDRGSLFVLEALEGSIVYWAWIPPVLLGLVVVAWIVSGRARSFPGTGWILGLVPGARGVVQQIAAADFAELLAILIEHEVPLPEAVKLATGATGHAALRRSGPVVAEALSRGVPLSVESARDAGIPPLLGWVLSWGSGQGLLAPALRSAASMYRRRARLRADLMRTLFPALALLVVGATAALVYAMVLFMPLSSLLESAARGV